MSNKVNEIKRKISQTYPALSIRFLVLENSCQDLQCTEVADLFCWVPMG